MFQQRYDNSIGNPDVFFLIFYLQCTYIAFVQQCHNVQNRCQVYWKKNTDKHRPNLFQGSHLSRSNSNFTGTVYYHSLYLIRYQVTIVINTGLAFVCLTGIIKSLQPSKEMYINNYQPNYWYPPPNKAVIVHCCSLHILLT